jgi:hypothetical protein
MPWELDVSIDIVCNQWAETPSLSLISNSKEITHKNSLFHPQNRLKAAAAAAEGDENEAKIFRGNEQNDNHLRKEIKSNHVCVDNEPTFFLFRSFWLARNSHKKYCR